MSEVYLSIIIVNWNTGGLLRRSVESILRHPPGCTYEIVVVDNASEDDSIDLVRDLPVSLLLNRHNVGFSRANNQAIRRTTAPYLLLLNPDTEVYAGSLDRLLAAMKADSRAAVAGARLHQSDGRLQVSVRHNPPNPLVTLADGLLLCYLVPQPWRGEWLLDRHWDHARLRAVPRVSGCAMLVRRAAVHQAGLLDESYHLYGEDDEWCLRFRRHGWKVLFVPDSVVLHHRHQSGLVRWGRDGLAHQIVSSRLRQQFKSLPRSTYVANLVATLAVNGPALAWRKLRGGSDAADTPLVSARWRLYWHELLGRLTRRRWPSAMVE